MAVMELEERVNKLESLLAFQEDLIETLNQALITQNSDIDRLSLAFKKLKGFVECGGDEGIKDLSDEVPPPHY